VAFYVRKLLAHGPIRFGVPLRGRIEDIDRSGLSTGPSGEFLKKRTRGFFLADNRAIGAPELPRDMSLATAPFWSAVVDGTRRGWIFAGMMAFGALLILLGLGVVVNKGPQGWIQVILGAALISTPIIITAGRRRQVREAEKKERAEREERERRHRASLGSYATALEQLRRDTNDETLAAVARERDALELPYDVWSGVAKQTVLLIGFQTLARLTPARAEEIAASMDRASAAVGLSSVDEREVKLDLYRIAVWHVLSDDRLGEVQEAQLADLRRGLGVRDPDVLAEDHATDQFRRLRGMGPLNPPKHDCRIPLKFHEYCIHTTRAQLLKRVREKTDRRNVRYVPAQECTVYVTNKRLILDLPKRRDIGLPKIDDVEVDVDQNVLTISTPLRFGSPAIQVDDPIYTGALIAIATMIDDRPRGLA
jgi:hypothetical protein